MTKDKKIKWKYDPFDDNVTAAVSSYKVKLEEGRDSEGSPLLIITIVSTNGDEIDRFDDEDLKDFKTSDPEHTSYWKLMSRTLHLAKRQARGADDAIDDILDDLDDLSDDPPF
jgi:hypothetical protein